MQLMQLSLSEMHEERIYYDGLGNLFVQPEFREDMDCVRALVDALESTASPLLAVMAGDIELVANVTNFTVFSIQITGTVEYFDESALEGTLP